MRAEFARRDRHRCMWLIRTKLEAPAPTDRLIARTRLRRHLPTVLRSRLTLVHAPAGFGKTSLLAEWQRCLRARSVRTAWLSLDEDDSEPLQFLAYLTASLALAGLDVGHLGPAAERGFPDVPTSSLIIAITRAIERSRSRIVVLIDDCHRLRGYAVGEVLARLVEGSNGRVSFVIASRERPAYFADAPAGSIGRLELSGDELRFAADEARELLRRGARTIADEDLDAITASTDGWAIALTAVRDWLANGWSVDRVRQSLALPAADLGRYITDQVLRSLSASEREFLRRTAIVDRFSEDLAATLGERHAAHDVIASLERKDLLVVIWDGDQRWFRYHRLLAEMAVAEAERERPALVADLHRRAAQWFFKAGHHAEAVRHAAATRDDDLLAQLFEHAGGWKLIISGHVGLTRNALALIPPAVLRNYPRSHLASILVLAKQGRMEEARRELGMLMAVHADRADELLQIEVALFDTCLQCYEDVPTDEEQCAALARVSAGVPHGHLALRGMFANTLCTIHFECGDLEAAIVTADEALVSYRAVRSLFGEVFVYVHQGRALLEIGRLRDAQVTLRQAWRQARDTTGPNTETEAVAAAMLALAEYESGNLEEAERLVTPALGAIEQGESWFELFASAYTTACALVRHREGTLAALAVVRRARQTAMTRNLPRLERLADALEMRERVLDGENGGSDVARLESALAASASLERAPRLRMRAALELARLSLARGHWSIASMSASRIAAEAKVLRHQRVRVEALIVHSLALHSLGQTEAAAGAFDSAVSLAMYEGYRRVFCDFGARLLPLLQMDDFIAPDRRLTRVRDRFLAGVIDSIHVQQQSQVTTPGLSDRERMVLLLLKEGLSNKAIAKALQVSANTVKFHMKNLFAKLGVGSRADAVAALEQQLRSVTDSSRSR
jgi:LuxR family transcriptional regulator, maltose regulon positive regulatory protein